MRLVTLNAASGRGPGLPPDTHRLAAAVASLGADVVALQEVDHLLPRSGAHDQAAYVAAACAGDRTSWTFRFAAAMSGAPGEADCRPASRTEVGKPSYGIALVTRHQVMRWSELRMPPARAWLPVPLPPETGRRLMWVPDEQRVALAAVTETPLGVMTVVTTHLSFAPTRAISQLRDLRRWAGDLPRPLVVMGDLNLPGNIGAAVTGWRPLVRAKTFPAPSPRMQLDHVLVDGWDHPVQHAEARHVGSDHLALVVDLA